MSTRVTSSGCVHAHQPRTASITLFGWGASAIVCFIFSYHVVGAEVLLCMLAVARSQQQALATTCTPNRQVSAKTDTQHDWGACTIVRQ